MASTRRRGERFTGLYRDATGAQKSAGTYDTEDEALARAKVKELDARPPKPVEVHASSVRGRITVAGYAPGWLERRVSLEPNTRDTYESSVKHIVRTLGGTPVQDATTEDVQRLIRALRKLGRSDATVRHVVTVASLMFKSAVKSGLCDDNPCDDEDLKVKIRDQREMMIATREQAEAIEDAMPERYKLLVRALFATGCRWSEMIGLCGTDVGLKGSVYVVKIRRTVNETWKVGLYEKPYGKSEKATRDISVPAGLAKDLMACGGRLCFPNTAGGWLRRADFRQRAWIPACKAAGIQGLRVHDTRHSAISWWANSGIPLAAVRDRAGHSNISVTSRYIHVMPGEDPFLAALGEAA